MAEGPGKYDAECTAAREATGALGVILMVFGGREGHGFAVQAPEDFAPLLPQILRDTAASIEADLEVKHGNENLHDD